MAQLEIREYRGGTATPVTDSSLLVDVWFNEELFHRLMENKIIEDEHCLICVHWGQAVDKKTFCSASLTSQDNFNRPLALYLETNSDKLFEFITTVFGDLGMQLLCLTLSPITFTFQHECQWSQQDNNNNTKLKAILEEFIKHAVKMHEDVAVQIKSFKLHAHICPGGNLECSLMSKSGSTSRSVNRVKKERWEQKTGGNYWERFARIEAELSKRHEVISNHFQELKKRNKEICHKITQIAVMLPTARTTLHISQSDHGKRSCTLTGAEERYSENDRGDLHTPLKREISHTKKKCTDSFKFQASENSDACESLACLGEQKREDQDQGMCQDRVTDQGTDQELKGTRSALHFPERNMNSKQAQVPSTGFSFTANLQCMDTSGNPDTLKADVQLKRSQKTPEIDRTKDGHLSNDDVRSYSKPGMSPRRQHNTSKLSVPVKPVDGRSACVVTSLRRDHLTCTTQDVIVEHYSGTLSSATNLELRDKILRQGLRVDKEISKATKDAATAEAFSCMRKILGYTLGDPWGAVEEALSDYDNRIPVSITGTDTILCLDNSSIAESGRLKEMVHSFINGIDKISETTGQDENICLVEIGQYFKLLHQLSNDYGSLRKSIESMTFGGSTSCVESLLVCLAGLSKGGVCNFGGNFRVAPRVIVITDGITDNSFSSAVSKKMTDIFFTSLRQLGLQFIMEPVTSPIIAVPQGIRNTNILRNAVVLGEGTVVEDITTLCGHQTIQRLCAKIIQYLRHEYRFWTDRSGNAKSAVEAATADLCTEDKKQVSEIITEYFMSSENMMSATDAFDNVRINETATSVPVGSRVVPGPDMTTQPYDGEWSGTVINHGYYTGTVWIQWDHGPCRLCRYGYSDKYEVLIAEEQSRAPNTHGSISIGMQVERGPHWQQSQYVGCDDFGSYGTVIRVWKNRVGVIWKNQVTCEHLFGENGYYHVIIRNAFNMSSGQSNFNNHGVCTAMEASCFDGVCLGSSTPGGQLYWGKPCKTTDLSGVIKKRRKPKHQHHEYSWLKLTFK